MSRAETLAIPAEIFAAMVEHCRREAPMEACGILGGVPPLVSSIHPLRNVEQSAVLYTADPVDLIATDRALRERGAEWLVIYHSHPRSAPIPSKVDLKLNYDDPTPKMIISLMAEPPQARLWRLSVDAFEELPWRLLPAVDVEYAEWAE